jgi:hypothetical protein
MKDVTGRHGMLTPPTPLIPPQVSAKICVSPTIRSYMQRLIAGVYLPIYIDFRIIYHHLTKNAKIEEVRAIIIFCVDNEYSYRVVGAPS